MLTGSRFSLLISRVPGDVFSWPSSRTFLDLVSRVFKANPRLPLGGVWEMWLTMSERHPIGFNFQHPGCLFLVSWFC